MVGKGVARLGVLVSTAALAWAALAVGTEPASTEGPQVGEPAERDYIARTPAEVEDDLQTETLRQAAADEVSTRTVRDPEVEESVFASLDGVLTDVRDITSPIDTVAVSIPAQSTTTTTTESSPPAGGTDLEETPVDEAAPVEEADPAEEPLPTTTLTGLVFVDVDRDGVFDETAADGAWRSDLGLQRTRIVAVSEEGEHFEATTVATGGFAVEVPQGAYTVYVDSAAPFPEGFGPVGEATMDQEVVCDTEECEVEPTPVAPNLADLDQRVSDIRQIVPTYSNETVTTLTVLAEQDLIRALTGDPLGLAAVEDEAVDRLTELFLTGVTIDDLQARKDQAALDRRSVFIDGRTSQPSAEAVNQLVSQLLTNNYVNDQVATEAAREEARQEIEAVTVFFREDDVIARQGEILTDLDVAAIEDTRADIDRTVRQAALAGVLAVLVAVLGYYLGRFRKNFWNRPRMVALLGMLIVLAAGAVRLTIQFEDTVGTAYVLPAVAFGYLAAVLFDNRMGTLMALAMGVLAAVGTGDPGLAVYAALATLAPVGFVSAVSSRRAFRNSVVISGVAAGLIAAACTWFFNADLADPLWPQIWPPALYATVVALFASLIALAAMPFFEAMFDVTTTLRLLELIDRNHEALQLIQEKAFGTFNHSLMVGTLADTAAKAIGADNILALAAAYYHDIGKTENPTYFIENQFGSTNPHDEMPPEESAAVIRQHVLDGIDLAQRYNIPSQVSEGIVAHHGDGIMRFFYEKARQMYGEDAVDPNLYRHAGHKPRSQEMAILMMADAVEGACRAVFAEEEPTPESIAKVVNRVVDEKVADGQLSESALTLGELTRVREAFIGALIGHYHQRIPYPNFPGS